MKYVVYSLILGVMMIGFSVMAADKDVGMGAKEALERPVYVDAILGHEIGNFGYQREAALTAASVSGGKTVETIQIEGMRDSVAGSPGTPDSSLPAYLDPKVNPGY